MMKGRQELQVNQLSDGEKVVLSLVGDLARRLAVANPGLDRPLEGQGFALVDEVDLHLHPSWQRLVMRRLTNTFLKDEQGRRPVYGGSRKFQEDPHWRDLILFYEYFHGDNGSGAGANHQTGWTGLVSKMLQQSGE